MFRVTVVAAVDCSKVTLKVINLSVISTKFVIKCSSSINPSNFIKNVSLITISLLLILLEKFIVMYGKLSRINLCENLAVNYSVH